MGTTKKILAPTSLQPPFGCYFSPLREALAQPGPGGWAAGRVCYCRVSSDNILQGGWRAWSTTTMPMTTTTTSLSRTMPMPMAMAMTTTVTVTVPMTTTMNDDDCDHRHAHAHHQNHK